jgi:hypothetical protein
MVVIRVARWFIFKPKIPIWGNFGGPKVEKVEKCGYILWPFGIFYRHLGYFKTIWYILCTFGDFFHFWHHDANTNLATLVAIGPKLSIVSETVAAPRFLSKRLPPPPPHSFF